MDSINKFFKWMYTSSNGMEYMTFWECSFEDMTLVITTGVLCFGVLTVYGLIAYDSYKKGLGYKESSTKKYHDALMKVFMYCAATGYGYTILSIWTNPYWLRVGLLVVLLYQAYKMLVSQKENTSIEKVYEMETALSEKYKDIIVKKAVLLDLFKERIFGTANEVSYITFEQLAVVPHEQPFDSDGRGVIENTRTREFQPGFTAESTMKPNSYIPPHCHDTWKILTCLEGKFHDSHSNKWYKKGDYLMIPPTDPEDKTKNWHDIKTDAEGVKLLTFIMPKQ